MNLFSIIVDIETNDNLHIGRLLVLLKAFAGNNREGSIDGIEKLAELDFLLRYPVYLERILTVRGKPAEAVNVNEYERYSIESNRVAYNYHPWSVRYRRFMNLLIAKDLAYINIEDNKIKIGLTTKGIEMADDLSKIDTYITLNKRAKLIKQGVNLTSSNIMNLFYETFPELSTLQKVK